MVDTHKKLTTLFENAGLQDLKGYVYCGLIEKLYKFSILNNACKSDSRMPTPSTDTPQERFQKSIDFYRPVWRDLVEQLQNEGGDFSAVGQSVTKRIKEMENELDTHKN